MNDNMKKLLTTLSVLMIVVFGHTILNGQCEVIQGEITTSTGDTTLRICAGDGISDAFEVSLTGNVGQSRWIITDPQGVILGLPDGPPFDLEGAGTGVCLVWHMSFMDTLTGVEVGANANNIMGCFALSNPITVTRTGVKGGIISLTDSSSQITICAGDGLSDAFEVLLSDTEGPLSAWVITDPDGKILGLPNAPPFDLEGAGEGTCLIWHLQYEEGLSGLDLGLNVDNLTGCYSFSNAITVHRIASDTINGGTISTSMGDTLSICAGDGISDAFDVDITGASGASGWIITDPDGKILGIPPGPPFDLEEAGEGTCLIWHMSFIEGLSGLEVGNHVNDIQGCYVFSNSIVVQRTGVNGGDLTTESGLVELTICAGDGRSDAFGIELTNQQGSQSGWIITDPEGNILGLPDAPPFDLEEAGEGTCLIWHISFSDTITGMEIGLNAGSITGCHDLSNPITVNRVSDTSLVGGQLSLMNGDTTITICAGDGVSDSFEVTLSGESGANSGWVITDPQGNILGVPTAPPFDLEGAGSGVCLIWHIASASGLTGVAEGNHVSDIQGCYALSNAITVIRHGVNGGELATADGDTVVTICAGDSISDAFEIMLTDTVGTHSAWVITDPQGEILGLPGGPPFDLEGAGEGTCLIWHISYNDTLSGLEIGLNADSIEGCYDLSNPITVTRVGADGIDGGILMTQDSSTELTICAGDGLSDAFEVLLSDTSGPNSGWVITDPDGNILGVPAGPPFDLEDAGTGICLVWHISYVDGFSGVEVGNNTSNLQGCYDLSNPITVTRNGVSGGTLTTTDDTTEITICAGDGTSDAFEVNLNGHEGSNSGWVITDPEGNILGLPAGPPFDLEGAGTGVCLIWHISSHGDLTGLEIGANANEIQGCYALSNAITVIRHGVSGGTLTTADSTTEVTICAGDGESDAFEVYISGHEGDSSDWVITDPDGNILGLPTGPPFDLEGAGTGVCLIWHLSYNGSLTGVEVGANTEEIQGCYSLSNPITVTRNGVSGGSLTTEDGFTALTICAGDGESDAFSVHLEGNEGNRSGWVITDPDGNILGVPEGPPFDLEGAGEGICYVWHLSYNGELNGVEVGDNTANIEGCFALSNPIIATRKTGIECPGKGQFQLENGMIEANENWQTITLKNTYSSMVVVASVHLKKKQQKPVVTRIRNAEGNSFEIRLQNPGGSVYDNYEVSYLVVEEGIYNESEHGVKMEAKKYDTEVTAGRFYWQTETRSYENTYMHPIVLGQVMTYNDTRWSQFWASRIGIRNLAPTATSFAAGKHVGEDYAFQRENESIGVIIVEEGAYRMDEKVLHAGKGRAIVQGVQNNPQGTRYDTRLDQVDNAVLSSAGMRSRDGGIPVFLGDQPFADGELRVAIDEDQLRDKERRHFSERLAFIAFGEGLQFPKKKSYHIAGSKLEGNNSTVLSKIHNSQLAVFPNPASDHINVQFDHSATGEGKVVIVDMIGKTLSVRSIDLIKGVNQIEVSTSDLPEGMYTLRVVRKGQSDLQTKLSIIN